MKKLASLLVMVLLIIACSKDENPSTIPTIPVCESPTGVTVSNISDDNATISWTNPNATSSFEIEYGLSGFSVGTGTLVSSTQTSITLAGLLPDTSYDIYIKAICSSINESMFTNETTFTTGPPRPIAELLPNLSYLNLFIGDIKDLVPSQYGFTYVLNTTLFSDYSKKARFIVLPEGETMTAQGDLMPDFPDNTIIVKSFFYNYDETNLGLGRRIMETRLLIKKNGAWVAGDYHWNDAQTEAVLNDNEATVPITYVNEAGSTVNVNYKIPSNLDCATCHQTDNETKPLGPKLRSINFNNQLEDLINNNQITGLTDTSTVSLLPDWEDDANYTLEERARAYMDVNCASCHQPGGHCEVQTTLDLRYETSFADSDILPKKDEINTRMATYVELYSMPLLGTTFVHTEGYFLIKTYLNSL